MALTTRDLNRATLARQLLLARGDLDVPSAVRQVLALQAQEPASPHLGLWARVAGFDPALLHAAFHDGVVVKATLARITLHAVHRDDHATFHLAMQPTLRGSGLNDRRFRDPGHTVAAADALVPDLLVHLAEPRTNAEVVAWLAARGVPDPDRMWWAVRRFVPVRHTPGDDAWSFPTSPRHQALPGAVPDPADPAAADVALGEVLLRYLAAFGPATIADAGRFLLVPLGRLRPVVAALGERVVHLEGPDGATMLDVPDGLLPGGDLPAPPRLLPMWDSLLLAHADRTRVLDDDVRAEVIRRNGDTLPTVLVDGRVVGVWRHVDGRIEARALRRVSDDDWDGLAAEAADLLELLDGRDGEVYGRHRRWWDRLPDGQDRVLAAV